MIESLRLRNFQNHTDRTIKFSPLVTSLVGPTNAGKSAIIRMLRLILLNKLSASPDSYITHGKEWLAGVLKVDGHTVVRRRGKGSNLYKLDGKVFRSFGNGVPEEIAKLLQCSEANFQRQIDLPFWFTESPGQVSRNLNSIINLGVIDDTLASVASLLREARSEKAVCESRLREAKIQKHNLKWVPACNAALQRIEAKKEQHARITHRMISVGQTVRDWGELLREREMVTETLLGGKELILRVEALERLRGERDALRELVGQWELCQKVLSGPRPDISHLLVKRKQADGIAERRRELESIVTELEALGEEKCQVKAELKALNKRLASVKVCPACGQEIKSSSPQSAICTSPTHRRPSGQKNLTGTRPKNDNSRKFRAFVVNTGARS